MEAPLVSRPDSQPNGIFALHDCMREMEESLQSTHKKTCGLCGKTKDASSFVFVCQLDQAELRLLTDIDVKQCQACIQCAVEENHKGDFVESVGLNQCKCCKTSFALDRFQRSCYEETIQWIEGKYHRLKNAVNSNLAFNFGPASTSITPSPHVGVASAFSTPTPELQGLQEELDSDGVCEAVDAIFGQHATTNKLCRATIATQTCAAADE